jgi:hypothetical protein
MTLKRKKSSLNKTRQAANAKAEAAKIENEAFAVTAQLLEAAQGQAISLNNKAVDSSNAKKKQCPYAGRQNA